MLDLMRMLFGLSDTLFCRAVALPNRNIGPKDSLQNVNPCMQILKQHKLFPVNTLRHGESEII